MPMRERMGRCPACRHAASRVSFVRSDEPGRRRSSGLLRQHPPDRRGMGRDHRRRRGRSGSAITKNNGERRWLSLSSIADMADPATLCPIRQLCVLATVRAWAACPFTRTTTIRRIKAYGPKPRQRLRATMIGTLSSVQPAKGQAKSDKAKLWNLPCRRKKSLINGLCTEKTARPSKVLGVKPNRKRCPWPS